MVTKNTTNKNDNNDILNTLPASLEIVVDNDEKYLTFSLVFALMIMGATVRLYGTDGFVLYTYVMQDTVQARDVFDELVTRFKNFFRLEEVYTTDTFAFRMKHIYGVNLFEHDGKSILNLFDKKGYPVLSETGKPGSLDEIFLDIKARLHGGYTSKKFLQLHDKCFLSAQVNPSVEKIQRGVLIKSGEKLISFIHEDDDSRKAALFKSVVDVIKS
ncbi:hypothetical protein KNZ39_003026 [Escherichia coli]|nr:hypothetical protein [Escherichia coli]